MEVLRKDFYTIVINKIKITYTAILETMITGNKKYELSIVSRIYTKGPFGGIDNFLSTVNKSFIEIFDGNTRKENLVHPIDEIVEFMISEFDIDYDHKSNFSENLTELINQICEPVLPEAILKQIEEYNKYIIVPHKIIGSNNTVETKIYVFENINTKEFGLFVKSGNDKGKYFIHDVTTVTTIGNNSRKVVVAMDVYNTFIRLDQIYNDEIELDYMLTVHKIANKIEEFINDRDHLILNI